MRSLAGVFSEAGDYRVLVLRCKIVLSRTFTREDGSELENQNLAVRKSLVSNLA